MRKERVRRVNLMIHLEQFYQQIIRKSEQNLLILYQDRSYPNCQEKFYKKKWRRFLRDFLKRRNFQTSDELVPVPDDQQIEEIVDYTITRFKEPVLL